MAKITKKQRDLILQFALGDGHISKQGYLRFTHGKKQKDYITWKRERINKYYSCTPIQMFDNSGYVGYRFSANLGRYGKLARKILYPNGVKTITKRSLKLLTLEGLAIWYADDGSLSQKKRGDRITANELTLSTGFGKDTNTLIAEYLKASYELNFTVVKDKNVTRLRCGTREARKFLPLIYPYFPKELGLDYKLNVLPCRI